MNKPEFSQSTGDDADSGCSSPPRVTVVSTPGSPHQYPIGARVLVAKTQVWLCRDEAGFYAVDAYCPHLGCMIRPDDDGFLCMCHGSRFDSDGECCSKPALTGLRHLHIELSDSGNLVIRRDRSASPSERFIA